VSRCGRCWGSLVLLTKRSFGVCAATPVAVAINARLQAAAIMKGLRELFLAAAATLFSLRRRFLSPTRARFKRQKTRGGASGQLRLPVCGAQANTAPSETTGPLLSCIPLLLLVAGPPTPTYPRSRKQVEVTCARSSRRNKTVIGVALRSRRCSATSHVPARECPTDDRAGESHVSAGSRWLRRRCCSWESRPVLSIASLPRSQHCGAICAARFLPAG